MLKLPLPNRKTFSLRNLKNRAALVRSLRGGKPVVGGFPTILYVESTNRCNLDCLMCPRRLMTRLQMDMNLGLFNSILDQLDTNYTELVVLHSDGEPLVNPDILPMIRDAKMRGLRVMTSTNATLLSESVAEQIIASRLDVLTISIDGTDAHVYEHIRRGASFNRVMKNTKRFLKMKGRKKPFTILQMIKMKENEHQADDFLDLWGPYKKYDAHAVVKPMTDWFNRHSDVIDNVNFCDRPWFGMVVQSNGNVVPCVHDFDGDEVLGTLPRDNIYDIWNSEKMISLRRGIGKSRRSNRLCRECNATSPRHFNLISAAGLTFVDMGTIAKTLGVVGYDRPRQY